MKRYFCIILFVTFLLFTGCKSENDTIIEIACFNTADSISEEAALFAQNNKDFSYNVTSYYRSENIAEDGVEKIKRELLSGQGPDIIDFGSGYSITDILGEYTIDLMPYFEKEESDFFQSIVNAFKYNGALYAVPSSVWLDVLSVNSDYSNGLTEWDASEIIECYKDFYEKKGGYFYCGTYKEDVLHHLLSACMNSFVDWKTGECFFESENFKSIVEFANMFSEYFDFPEEAVLIDEYRTGNAMVYPGKIVALKYIAGADALFPDEKAVYIGYPTENGSSALFQANGHVFAITKKCKNPELAFEFINTFFEDEYQYQAGTGMAIPVIKHIALDILNEEKNEEFDTNGNVKTLLAVGLGGQDMINITHLTEEQCEKVISIIESADSIENIDNTLYNIAISEIMYYFSGEKSLDEICRIIQSRASLYVQERLN